jgi:beta-N-acetylhexosaminidase
MLAPLTSDRAQWVNDTLQGMTVPQCVGQLLCAQHPRYSTADWVALLERVPLGCVNIRGTSMAGLRERMAALQDRSSVPLLVSGDLEHGAVVLNDATEFPFMMAAGAANDEELMRAMGEATAAEARCAGLHWAFAPVIDLNYCPDNPITNVRALSDQPQRVIRLATAFVHGLQAGGRVAATAKHFPGDGVDDRDHHLCTSVNHLPLEQWRGTYGRVWRAVIDAGVMCVMPGHISLPDYQGFAERPEEAPPATLSPRLLVDLLRNELGFDGLVVSDASPMIGLTSRVRREERAIRAVESGIDVYLFPDTVEEFSLLVEAVRRGRLAEERVRQAARRVLELKARLGLHRDPFGPQPSDVARDGFRKAARSMADRSITVLRSDGKPPLQLAPGAQVLTVTVGQLANPYDRRPPQPDLDAFDEELRSRGYQVEHLLNPTDDVLLAGTPGCAAVFLNLVALPYMVLGTIRNLVGHFGHWSWRSFFADHPQVAVTSFGNPYVLREMPHLPNLLAAYGNSPISQRAAVRVWLGEIAPVGDCPVSLPRVTIRPL